MKRKAIAALLIGVILCLSGCGVQKPADNKPENIEVTESVQTGASETVESTDVAEPKVTEKPAQQEPVVTEAPPEIATPTKQNDYLKVSFEYVSDSAMDEICLMYGNYDKIRLHTDSYPALTKAVEEYNAEHAGIMQAYMDEQKEWASEEYKEYGAEMFNGPFVTESELFCRRADKQVLSLMDCRYSYSGGAHGNTGFDSVNFDVATGERIPLESVIKDKTGLIKALETKLKEKYPHLSFYGEAPQELLQAYISPADAEMHVDFVWTLDYDGVTFYFGNYELGGYAEGVQQVTITSQEYPELMERTYFTTKNQDYVVELNDCFLSSDVDLMGDGTTDYISVIKNYDEYADFIESYEIVVNENRITKQIHCYEVTPYLVKSGGKTYLYLEGSAENDFRTVNVFEISEGLIEHKGEFVGGLTAFTNSLDFQIEKRLDLLGTNFIRISSAVGVDGMPVETDSVYNMEGNMDIVSTVEIPAELVDEQGKLLGESYTFPAGTTFRFMSTDGATYVDVQADSGQKCRFYTTSEWAPKVNGMDATSSFEMLYYAG